jgi:phosphocarrier protein HPr
MTAIDRTVDIRNKRGLHARAAAKFVKIVEGGRARVTVMKDGAAVAGSSIMGLLMLSAGENSQIRILAEGAGAAEIVQALAELVERRFDETA